MKDLVGKIAIPSIVTTVANKLWPYLPSLPFRRGTLTQTIGNNLLPNIPNVTNVPTAPEIPEVN